MKITMPLPRASDILTRPLFLLCALGLIVTTCFPQVGFGIQLCGFYRMTGLPCFGCGMTRSLVSFGQMEFLRAWQFHPFGIILWPLMLLFAVAGVKKSWSQLLNAKMRQHDRLVNPAFWLSLFFFFGFGIWRMCFMTSYFGIPHIQHF